MSESYKTYIYGDGGGFLETLRPIQGGGVWQKNIGSINQLHERDIVPIDSMYRVFDNDNNTRFWMDVWYSCTPFRVQLHRILLCLLVKRRLLVIYGLLMIRSFLGVDRSEEGLRGNDWTIYPLF